MRGRPSLDMFIALASLAISLLVAVAGWRARVAAHGASSLGRAARILVYLAPAAAIAAALFVVTVPSYESSRDGVTERLTIVDVNGVGVLIPLLIPVALAWIPAIRWAESRRVLLPASIGALLSAYCVLTGFSIGAFFVPSAAMLALGAALALLGRERATVAGPS